MHYLILVALKSMKINECLNNLLKWFENANSLKSESRYSSGFRFLVTRTGFEPMPSRIEGWCSTLFSYRAGTQFAVSVLIISSLFARPGEISVKFTSYPHSMRQKKRFSLCFSTYITEKRIIAIGIGDGDVIRTWPLFTAILR